MTFLQAALERLGEPSADDRYIRQLCICEADDCYCLETAEIPIVIAAESLYTCAACNSGQHVTRPAK